LGAFGRILNDERAVAVDRRVQFQRASGQECLPTAGAVPDHPDLAVGPRELAQIVGGTCDIADEPFVGYTACGAHGSRRIVGIRARRFA
jgi:hypothetical protein